MIVRIKHVHNHPITGNAKVMQYRDVSEETIKKFKDLFARGYTPASALKMHKFNLHMEHTTNYKYLAFSLSRLESFVYRLYAKVFQKRDGADSENFVIPEELTTLKMRFHNFVASVEKPLNENTNEYAPAVEAFLSKWERIKTDSGRVSALHTFGKDHNCMPFSVIKRSGIKVQSTAVSRRCTPLGGRRYIQSGRLPRNRGTENKGLKRLYSEHAHDAQAAASVSSP